MSLLKGCIRVRAVRSPGGFSARLPQVPEGRTQIVLCDRADDTNAQDDCHRTIEPIRRPVHSRPPAVATSLCRSPVTHTTSAYTDQAGSIGQFHDVEEPLLQAWTSSPPQAGRGTPPQCTTTTSAVAGRARSPRTCAGGKSQTRWSGAVRRMGFWCTRPSDTYYLALTWGFTIRVPANGYKAAGHKHRGSSPSGSIPQIDAYFTRTAQVRPATA